MAQNKKGLSRRMIAMMWMLLFAIVVGTLIAYEQISILYVLVTILLVSLLLIVGFADLEGVSRSDSENVG